MASTDFTVLAHASMSTACLLAHSSERAVKQLEIATKSAAVFWIWRCCFLSCPGVQLRRAINKSPGHALRLFVSSRHPVSLIGGTRPPRHVELGVAEARAPCSSTARIDHCSTGQVGGAHLRRQCRVLACSCVTL
ncbi:hypothetical protein NDU88_005594 [Pleurodeles waltl]|uniref:Secreted protein n=1 Tax=Pleurodeles waltl TaxID=8319 RepID=A0AAV7MAZ9_PLEWA|nr:hypothetical protein NDU88_005594 [Pleurodeles waltl]